MFSISVIFLLTEMCIFVKLLDNDFLRNRPIYESLFLQDGNGFGTDDLTCGKSTYKGVKNEKNLPYGAHRAFFHRAN